jgi:DNA-binding transcriptional LysR family regulator
VSLSRTHMLPIMVDFLSAYPNIRIQLSQSDRQVNLLEENVDLALRLGSLPDSSLIVTRVGLVRRVLCASPQYLALRGTPGVPEDLADHDCIASKAAYSDEWMFRKAGADYAIQIPHRLMVTTAETAMEAALAHVGIAHLMSYHCVDHVANGKLRMVLEEFEPLMRPVSLVYASQRQVPPKLRAFLDFATPRLRDMLGYKTIQVTPQS